MTQVNDRVLNWLYSVLTNEYLDINRTYSDVAEALAQYPSLSPKTEVYTYENGASALLLLVSGTIPVQFRGQIYRFPIALWVPHRYPQESPMVYVTPSQGMVVRPGQHVGGEGRVYHPYLSGWNKYWDKSSISDFLTVLRGVFAKEPPVVAKQPDRYGSPHPRSPAPPPVPPTPEEWRRSTQPQTTASPVHAPAPPPKPPKVTDGSNGNSYTNVNGQDQHRGPPLPPLPSGVATSNGRPANYPQPPMPQQYLPQRQASLGERPLPPTPQQLQMQPPRPFLPQQYEMESPVSPMTPEGQPQRYPMPSQPIQGPPNLQQPPQYIGSNQYPPNQYPTHPQPLGIPQRPNYIPSPATQPQPKPPQPDLLSSPLDVTLPSQTHPTTPLPVPPVPPNPEKDALLRALSTTLVDQTTRAITDNAAAITPLLSQQSALRTAHQRLEAELAQLQELDAVLERNEKVLREAMQEADRTVTAVKQGRWKVPDVDEVLVAPTVVGTQLWGVVAEERALGEAVFLMGRAVERGRVGCEGFAKQTRSLAREQFLKKALIKKISKGMGLD
ncbi:UEV-domain-containing protein, partial [Saccharata proteae CBS 121410]